jgi:hypothetical protein
MNKISLLYRVGKAILIWLATNLLGTAIVMMVQPSLNMHDIQFGISLTLLSSAPAVIILVPIDIGLKKIQLPAWQIAYSMGTIFSLCTAVIFFFSVAFGLPLRTVTELVRYIVPYFLAAQFCFLAFNKTVWLSVFNKSQS